MRWIIGDVHGQLRPLEALLGAISKVDPAPRLIFVGDYVNRGPDSKGVIDLLLTLSNASFLRGNHDDIFDEIIHGESYAENATNSNRLVAFRWFLRHGLDNTLASYGIDASEWEFLATHPTELKLDLILEAVPESHRQFIHNLIPVVEEPDFFVAHGKWDVDDPADNPSLADRLRIDLVRRKGLLWGRFALDEILRIKAWSRTGYFGHTPVDAYPELSPRDQFLPIIVKNMVLLDTAAALQPEGRLTAFCHEARSYLQATRAGKVLAAPKAEKV